MHTQSVASAIKPPIWAKPISPGPIKEKRVKVNLQKIARVKRRIKFAHFLNKSLLFGFDISADIDFSSWLF